ncbi:MAG: AraC family transcriptional regulator [Eubacterium sp.]|nr:AraC family transcriptional regulator [Eubacterium sp.]
MRKLDKKLLEIIKTETEKERLLNSSKAEREKYIESSKNWSGKANLSEFLEKDITVTRRPRYVDSPANILNVVEMYYVAQGDAVLIVNDNEIALKEGDIFLKNRYTNCGIKALGRDDIVIAILLKPYFLENAYVCLDDQTTLSEFMLDTLKNDVSWNKYLHFTEIEDTAVMDLLETIIYLAFPCMNDKNMACGSEYDETVMEHLMIALMVCLSRTLNTLAEDSAVSYDEIIKQTVLKFIEHNYQTVSLQEMAEALNSSESALSRQIKSIFGMGYKELLLKKRFERAEMLLKETNLSIVDIAVAVGYENTSFFYRRFRDMYGMSPKDYRKKM